MATGKDKRKKRRPRKPDNPDQSKRFVEAAKALGVDESGKAFEEVMKKLKPKGHRGSN